MSALASGSQTLFKCENARLVKHIPSLASRVNGAAPRDPIGAYGRKTSRDLILADWQGTLYVDSVPDPFNDAIRTLVISVEIAAPRYAVTHFGAERRCALPFRSYQQPSAGPKQDTLHASREIFSGLTSGMSGVDDASFWFFEDSGEKGALQRAQEEAKGTGRRAVWTCFVPGEWQQAVTVRSLLSDYPNHADAPHQGNDVPPSSSANDERLQGVRKSLFLDHWAPDEMFQALPNVQTRPSLILTSTAPLAAVERAATVAPDNGGPIITSMGHGAELSAATSMAHRRSTINSRLGKSVLSSYRNSLIAVDNETGDIIGVLAENVQLRGQGDVSPKQEALSSDEEQEAITPDQDDGPEWVMADGSKERSSVLRPASRYLDLDDERVRPPSRTASVLREDTFAPPPLPSKIRDSSRDSMASAAFFTAAETASEDTDDDDDSDKEYVGDVARLRLDVHDGIEAHQPHLLRDKSSANEDYASDASGSTIGGPAVRLWRKARGKKSRGARNRSEALQSNAVTAPAAESLHLAEDRAEDQADSGCGDQPSTGTLKSLIPEATRTLVPSTILPKARRDLLRTDEVQTAEDYVWTEAISSGELPVDAAYTHLHSSPSKDARAVFKLHEPRVGDGKGKLAMHGGTVLLEFLSDKKIGATLISGAQSIEENIAATIAPKSLIPVLPIHLLWFLGIANESNVPPTQRPAPSAVTIPSFESIRSMSANLPELLTASATASSTALFTTSKDIWTGISSVTTMATEWVFGKQGVVASEDAQAGERQAQGDHGSDDGSYIIPSYNAESWGATPRPVFRRRRPTPSLFNGYTVGSDDPSKYSILHIDGYARPRDVFMC